MTTNAERLLKIARDCKQTDIADELEKIIARQNLENTSLRLPLVGEFSSGKTTLINAVTDSKALETATKPTTSTIYQIFFGMDSVGAQVIFEDGTTEEVQDISTLKNERLIDASIVNIFDTSKKISSSTILFDTPGLSSSEQKHRENLVGFLPQADGILLVVDVNQVITKSMTDFVLETKMSMRPVYLILTKCDTKTKNEVENVKKYILQNSQLSIEKIICVSAKNDDMQEFYDLLSEIDKKKEEILLKVDKLRIRNVAKLLLSRIEDLILATKDVEGGHLDKAIREQEEGLSRLINNIKQLIDDVEYDAKVFEEEASMRFYSTVGDRLERIIAVGGNSQSDNAASSINIFALQYVNELKNYIQEKLHSLAKERAGGDFGVELNSLLTAEFSSIDMENINFNINLESIGHEHDKLIANITKGVLITGAIVATVVTAGAAAPAVVGATSAGAASAASAAGAAIAGSADALAVAGVSLAKEARIARMAKAAKDAAYVAESVESMNSKFGNRTGMKNGFIEGVVSKITNQTGKPQKRRVINDYIHVELIPQFKNELSRVRNKILSTIQISLQEEAKDTIAQKKSILSELKIQAEKNKDEFRKHLEMLNSYKKEIQID